MFVRKYIPKISKKTKDIQVNLKIERAFIILQKTININSY